MTEQQLPEPLVPPEVDLRGFSGFMLDVDRLLASELVALGTPEECWAAVMLWCRAWKQSPPGSLPSDERVLRAFSGAGSRWPKVRDMALRGFIRCSDGRLYHRVLCEEANEAWERRKRFKERSAKANERRWSGNHHGDESAARQGKQGTVDPNPKSSPSGVQEGMQQGLQEGQNKDSLEPPVTGTGTGTGTGQGLETTAAAPPPGSPPGGADPIFGPYLAWLQAKGMHPGSARNFLALMRHGYGDELVLEVLAEGQRQDVTKPLPWVKKALEARFARRSNRGTANRQEALEERNRRAVQDWVPPEMRGSHAAT